MEDGRRRKRHRLKSKKERRRRDRLKMEKIRRRKKGGLKIEEEG